MIRESEWNGIKIEVNEGPDPDEGLDLRGYEARPTWLHPQEFDAERVLAVKRFVSRWYGGRAHLAPITVLGDAGLADDAEDARDLGWLNRNWTKRYGGEPLEGWRARYSVRDGDGVGNARYNQVLHAIANMVTSPSLNDLHFVLGTGLMHACTGYWWGGWYDGRPRAEKGSKAYGDQSPSGWGGYSKWWPEQLAAFVALFPHPELVRLWGVAVGQLLAADPAWWDGNWGARGPANYGRALAMLHYLGWDVADRCADFVAHMEDRLGVEKYWINRPNRNVESPCMQFQLIEAVEVTTRIAAKAGHDRAFFHLDPLAFMLRHHTRVTDAGREVAYRVQGPEADYRYTTTNSAWGYRMSMALDMAHLATEFRAASYASNQLGRIDLPAGGPNHSKSLLIRAQCLGGDQRAFEELAPFVGR